MLFAYNCGGNSEQNPIGQKNVDDTIQQTDSVKSNSEEEEGGKVSLNNGVKWKANAETMKGISNMQQFVNNYLANISTANPDTLRVKLEKEFSSILEKCTMTGEAHQQLHYYLIPLKKKISLIKKLTNLENAKDIQLYLSEFEKYFQ